jgi:hypothetical protein
VPAAVRTALPGRRRAGARQLTCCPRGARQSCQRARPQFADAAAPSSKRRMSTRQRRRAVARAGAWVRISRSWLRGLVKAAMRAAKRGLDGRDRVATTAVSMRASGYGRSRGWRCESLDTAGRQRSARRRSKRCASRPTYRIRVETVAGLAIAACGDRAFLDRSPLRPGLPLWRAIGKSCQPSGNPQVRSRATSESC